MAESTSRFSAYRNRKKVEVKELEDELSQFRVRYSLLQEILRQKEEQIVQMSVAAGTVDELRRQTEKLEQIIQQNTEQMVALARAAQDSQTRYELSRTVTEAELIERVLSLDKDNKALKERVSRLESMILPPDLARYALNRIHSDREQSPAGKAKADAVFQILNRHRGASTLPQ